MRRKFVLLILSLLVLPRCFQMIICTNERNVEMSLDEIAIVAAHPFNWASYGLWGSVVDELHIQFLDRATGFMEGRDWDVPLVDMSTVAHARSKNVLTASYMVLTPIPPYPSPQFRDPQGKLGPLLQVCGGRDINQKLLYHSDNTHVTLCVSCPDWYMHFRDSAVWILNQGVDAIDIDNIADPPFAFGGDFSDWSVFAFRQYLEQNFSPSELASMKIDNPRDFDIRGYLSPTLSPDPNDTDILVICSPRVAFGPSEVEAMKSYVSQGGGLLVQVEPATCAIANQLMENFGVSVKTGCVLSLNPTGDQGDFLIHDLRRDHDVMASVQFLTYNWGVALEVKDPRVTVLAQTDNDTWIDTNMDLRPDEGEQRGPFPAMISLDYGKGRVVIVGDRSPDCNFDSWRTVMSNSLLWLGKGTLAGKTLLFDESHEEEATISENRASSMDREHPDWYLYGQFRNLAESLGLKVDATEAAPTFPEDKVLREYVRFLHQELQKFVGSLASELDEYGMDVRGTGIPLFGNQWLGNNHDDNLLLDIALDSVLLSSYVDLIQIETMPTLPPSNRLTLTYRMGHAMAKNAKPVWQLGAFYAGVSGPAFNKVNLTALGIAEAYANGAIKELDLAGFPGVRPIAGTVVLPNGTVPPNIKSLMDFIWRQRSQLVGFKPYSKVAIVYSIPTFLWSTFPALGVYPGNERRELIGVADMLQLLHVPYDVVIFGIPQLFDDAFFIDRLSSYDVVILPCVTHLTGPQGIALRDYVERGGRLLLTSCLPSYDGEHEPLAESDQDPVREILENYPDRVTFLDEAAGSAWYENIMSSYSDGVSYEHIIQGFERNLARLLSRSEVLTPSLPRSVEVSVLRKGNSTTIHLINYQYDVESDSFGELKNVEILVDPSLVGEVRDVTYLSPGVEQPLDCVLEDGYLRLTIPSLAYWGFVVFNKPQQWEATLSEHSITYGQSVNVSGSVDSSLINSTVEVVYSSPRGTTVSRVVELSEDGKFSDTFTPDEVGSWHVTVLLHPYLGSDTVSRVEIELVVERPPPFLTSTDITLGIVTFAVIMMVGVVVRVVYGKFKSRSPRFS